MELIQTLLVQPINQLPRSVHKSKFPMTNNL